PRLHRLYPPALHDALPIFSAGVSSCVLTTISGLAGGSYGSDTPVKLGISPANALAYRPFTSRSAHTSSGALTNTSMKLVVSARTLSRTDWYGEMKLAITPTPFRE